MRLIIDTNNIFIPYIFTFIEFTIEFISNSVISINVALPSLAVYNAGTNLNQLSSKHLHFGFYISKNHKTRKMMSYRANA